jgi:hypothetical protein
MSEDHENDAVKGIEDEVKRIREAAEKAREEAGHDEGETEEDYNYRIANVPGIFGDTDTTAGVGATGTDVPSANNEQATAIAAAVEATDSEEADDASHDEARRQADPAADTAGMEEGTPITEDNPDTENFNELTGEFKAPDKTDADEEPKKKAPARRKRS